MNDEAGIFFTMLFAGFIGMGFVAFCSDQHVRPEHYQWAANSCLPNDGVRTLSADASHLTARCQNGAVFIEEKRTLEGKQ